MVGETRQTFSPGRTGPGRAGLAQHDFARRTRLHSPALCSRTAGGGVAEKTTARADCLFA